MTARLAPTATTAVGKESLVTVDVDLVVEGEVETVGRSMASSLFCKPNGRSVGESRERDLTEGEGEWEWERARKRVRKKKRKRKRKKTPRW